MIQKIKAVWQWLEGKKFYALGIAMVILGVHNKDQQMIIAGLAFICGRSTVAVAIEQIIAALMTGNTTNITNVLPVPAVAALAPAATDVKQA